MPKKKIINIIQELNRLIKEQFSDFKGLYLYGSQVKGNFHKDSDLDILIIFNETSRDKLFSLSEIICDLSYKYDIYIDFRTYTMPDLERNPVYYDEVVNKGIYYEAA